MITLEQLRPFCGTDPSRIILHEPCNRDGYTWATDGRIMVRVPELPDVPAPVGTYPNVAPTWSEFRPHANFQPLPELPPPLDDKETECPDCEGRGRVHCYHCDNWGNCNKCRGMGFIGSKPTWKWMRVDGEPFALGYLHKIAALPNPRVAIVGRGDIAQLCFVCDDGGEGILRGLRIFDGSPGEWKPEPAKQEARA